MKLRLRIWTGTRSYKRTRTHVHAATFSILPRFFIVFSLALLERLLNHAVLACQEELHDGEDIARCPSCSLILRVIYDPVGRKGTNWNEP